MYLSLAKFALSLARPRRWRSEPAIAPSTPRPAQPIHDTRAPSPALTEIIEPESEAILKDLKELNIKVRDFAYPASSSSSSRPLPPIAELFDPYRAISEYEYRLRLTPHIPISGKTMRRLFTLGWVPKEEATVRLRDIDWRAIEEYDSRNTGYPYRTMKWKTVPTAQERETLFKNGVPYFRHFDKIQAELRMEEEWREQERVRGEEAGERVERRLLEIQERERKKLEEASALALKLSWDLDDGDEGSPENDVDAYVLSVDTDTPSPPVSSIVAGKKRALERSPSTPNLAVSASTSDGPKRIKLSAKATATYTAPSRDSPQPPIDAPQPYQQYPAPLHAYDPRLYPHAASVIAAEDRPPPVVVLPGQATPPVSDDESDYALGVRLHKTNNGLKGLVRTKTFAQL